MEDAHQIWKKLNQRFSQPDDSRICHLQHLLCSITQGTKSVDSYFNELNGVWEELRSFCPLPHCSCGKCNEDCFQAFVDAAHKDYLFKFINGLNETFSALRSQIIAMKPFPNLDQAYNMVLREETQRSFILQSPILTEASAMIVKKKSEMKCTYCGKPGHLKENCYKIIGYPSDSNIQCSHCGKPGHLKDNCFKIVGYPPDFKFTKSKRNNQNSHVAAASSSYDIATMEPEGVNLNLSKDQVQKLIALLNDQIGVSSKPTSSSPPHLANFAGKS